LTAYQHNKAIQCYHSVRIYIALVYYITLRGTYITEIITSCWSSWRSTYNDRHELLRRWQKAWWYV